MSDILLILSTYNASTVALDELNPTHRAGSKDQSISVEIVASKTNANEHAQSILYVAGIVVVIVVFAFEYCSAATRL